MVNDRLHIICGNCGKYLDKDCTWEYISPIDEDDTGDVFIFCDNCGTVHSLNKYLRKEVHD